LKKNVCLYILLIMRLRMIILILAVFAFLSASTGGLLYYYSFRNAAFQKNEAQSNSRLKLLSDQLSFHLSEHIKPVKTLSGIREIRAVLQNTNLDSLYQANQILDHFQQSLGVEVCYLMDIEANTICSSNRNGRLSFRASHQPIWPLGPLQTNAGCIILFQSIMIKTP